MNFRSCSMSMEKDYSSFYQWIKQNSGHIHPQIRIESKEERGLFTSVTIESHTALVIIPYSLVVNRQHAELSDLPVDNERLGLVVFLLREHAKGEGSTWFPWLHLLEIDEDATDFLAKQMHLFECVEQSTLGQALTARYQQLQKEYDQLSQAKIVETSFDLFCTVDHLVWSRVLGLPEDEPMSLVPLIDFANHSLDASARWFLSDDKQSIILRAERQLHPDEEITISYGSKSNEELLYLYGFALPNNPNDRVTLPVSLSPDDPLLQEKLHLIEELHLPPRLTLDLHGQLTEESKRLAHILTKMNELDTAYLTHLYEEYQSQLNMCSEDLPFVHYYLENQKSIIGKAREDLK